MKPCMHIVKISVFSLNNVIARLTKILIFKVIFRCWKLVESFQIFFLLEEYWTRRPNFSKRCFWKVWFLKYFIFKKWAQFLSALFIILVSLTMTLFSKKVLLSNRCIHGFMPNSQKKSWTDSISGLIGYWCKLRTPLWHPFMITQ